MHYLDLTLPDPAGNLACDEALLDGCEEDSGPEVLRFWEPRDCFVVAGFSNSVAREVNIEACRRAGVEFAAGAAAAEPCCKGLGV